MNSKDNLLATMRHQKPDRIPWVPLIDRANTPCIVPERLNKKWDILETALYLHEVLDCDILLGCPIIKINQSNVEKTIKIEDDKQIEEYHFAGRSLRTVSRKLTTSGMVSSSITEYLLKNCSDLETFEMIIDDSYLEFDTVEFKRLSDGIGQEGVVHTYAPRSPIMQLIIQLMGLETTTFCLTDYPDEMNRIMKKMHARNRQYYQMISQANLDLDVIGMFEDQDIQLTSPDTYMTHIYPCMKEYCDICHEENKIFMMHACGKVKQFLSPILMSGIDAHHYLNSSPIGNISFAEARSLWKDRICIMAAVDPILQQQGNPDDVQSNLREILQQTENSDNLVIMSPLKPDIPAENILAIQTIMNK